MMLLAYNTDGTKDLLSVRRQDAAVNCRILLDKGSLIRLLDGCDLQEVASIIDERIPATILEFDLLYPNQPAIVA